MGYFKNQLIAEQVELGDRVPNPKPATDHVAYPTRKTNRHWYDISQAQVKNREVAYRYVVIGWLLIGASIGFAAGVMVVMFA